jgi:sugar phosphate isomerase/epimerase
MRQDQIAVQLYTLRALLAGDFAGTLRQVSLAGYRAVELAGLPPMTPEALRDRLAAEDLRPIASHESLESLREDFDGVVARLAIVGCPRLIVPWLPDAERTDAEGVRRLAGELNRLAEASSDHGIALGYHNHSFEFAALDGTTIWEIFAAELSDRVELELDVYWATVGGRDPIELIRTAGHRLRLLHMKDRSAGPDGGDVTPGDGILPWAAIVAGGTERGVEWYVVEEDNPQEVIEEITRGLGYLRGLATTDA